MYLYIHLLIKLSSFSAVDLGTEDVGGDNGLEDEGLLLRVCRAAYWSFVNGTGLGFPNASLIFVSSFLPGIW